MKKITLLIAIFIAGSLILLSPTLRAQSIETLGDTPIDSTSESTTDTTNDKAVDAGVPETGFAPTNSKALASTSVFIIGSLLGAALGCGIIKFRKKV